MSRTRILKETLITESEEIQWALDKFCEGVLPKYFPGSCVLLGNEDAPTRLMFYAAAMPTVREVPFLTVAFDYAPEARNDLGSR